LDDNYPAASSTSRQTTTASGANNGAGKQQILNFAAFDQGSDEDEESGELLRYFDVPRAAADADPVDW
jgi:hypothetical protein